MLNVWMAIDCSTADLRLPNILLPLLWTHQARIPILLPSHLSLGDYPKMDLGVHRHISALDNRIRIHNDLRLQAYLGSMDFMGWYEHAGLLYKSESVLPGSSGVQHRSGRCDRPDTDSKPDDAEAQFA